MNNSKSMKLRIRWAEVRPDMAAKWLQNVNTHNRHLSDARVAMYAADMKSNRWLQAAQPILFSDRGVLLDGQHRLAAVIESNTTHTFLIVEGVGDYVQLVVDGGRPRSYADKLRLGKSMDVTPRLVAIGRIMMRPIGTPRGVKHTTGELGDFMVKHDEAIRFAAALFQKSRRSVSQASVPAVVARAFYTHEAKRLSQFAEVLYSGVNRGEKDVAAIRLRDTLDDSMSRRVHLKDGGNFYDLLGKIETGLDAFCKGTCPQRLTASKVELFPLPSENDTAIAGRIGKREAIPA